MYREIGSASKETIKYLKSVLKDAIWKDVIGPDDNFKTYWHDVVIEEFPEHDGAFFLMIPPGGRVHRHKDVIGIKRTFHIPVETNNDCESWIGDKNYTLDVGKIYEVDREIEHESFNFGETNRTHLLIEIYGEFSIH